MHTHTMSYSNCRFYEEKYPEVESFVMVNVKQVGNIEKSTEEEHIDTV